MTEVRISPVDALFANGSYPIEFLFGYKKGFPTKRLRKALRKLAPVFWPPFGEYKDGLISSVDYREEDYYGEETMSRAVDLEGIREAGLEGVSAYRQKELRRLFFLKVVRFKDGILLNPKLNHVAGDGFSYFTLLSALASLAKPSWIPFRPLILKSMFAPHHGRTALGDFVFRPTGGEPLAHDEPLTVACEEIPKHEVQSLIREAAAADHLRISTNDVLSAMSVRKLMGIGGRDWGEKVRLTIPIDVRRQVPEYGPRFLGNGIMLHTLELDREQAKTASVKDTAGRIRAALPSLSREKYAQYLVSLEEMMAAGRWSEFRPYDPERGALVTNLSKLPADRLDFGTGGPELIMPVTAEKNSTAILSRGESYILQFAF